METVLIAQFRPAKEFLHDRVVNEDRITKDGAQRAQRKLGFYALPCSVDVLLQVVRADYQKLRR